ncbi:exodeoxyribonuclease VII large subunit [Kroppenstedtia sanguinis]|uniref:Exodeoxyribonuclease 7 large subunit n=1 Tax=Kroppenstedtia sanguinis TaxID=1380684 RepID=A0ABW4CBD0_9BACL
MREREQDVLTVSGLVQHLTQVIDEDPGLSRVWVQGEISNFKHHGRGHMYFTLKDHQTRIRAVMFAGNNRRLRFMPKDGDDVLVRGRVGVFERDGQTQLYVTHMQPNGVGELYVAFQQLRDKLDEEGLFSPSLKKRLPFFPRRVGVITSAHGAVVRDIITTIQRRSRGVDILVDPVPVQGPQAPLEIAQALGRMNQAGEVDVIIVGRGGGSLEELWAFNEEEVARSIRQSRIPVVSAVGHETDTTIADFVADVRASTPTAAAEMVVPHFAELQIGLKTVQERLIQGMNQCLIAERVRLNRWLDRPVFRRPATGLEQAEQRLDLLRGKLVRGAREGLAPVRSRLESRTYRLQGHHPALRVPRLKDRWLRLQRQSKTGMIRLLQDYHRRWQGKMEHLDALSPLKVMNRGYSLLYRYDEQELIQSVKQVQAGDLVRIRLSDGRLKCQIWGMEEDSNGKSR